MLWLYERIEIIRIGVINVQTSYFWITGVGTNGHPTTNRRFSNYWTDATPFRIARDFQMTSLLICLALDHTTLPCFTSLHLQTTCAKFNRFAVPYLSWPSAIDLPCYTHFELPCRRSLEPQVRIAPFSGERSELVWNLHHCKLGDRIQVTMHACARLSRWQQFRALSYVSLVANCRSCLHVQAC